LENILIISAIIIFIIALIIIYLYLIRDKDEEQEKNKQNQFMNPKQREKNRNQVTNPKQNEDDEKQVTNLEQDEESENQVTNLEQKEKNRNQVKYIEEEKEEGKQVNDVCDIITCKNINVSDINNSVCNEMFFDNSVGNEMCINNSVCNEMFFANLVGNKMCINNSVCNEMFFANPVGNKMFFPNSVCNEMFFPNSVGNKMFFPNPVCNKMSTDNTMSIKYNQFDMLMLKRMVDEEFDKLNNVYINNYKEDMSLLSEEVKKLLNKYNRIETQIKLIDAEVTRNNTFYKESINKLNKELSEIHQNLIINSNTKSESLFKVSNSCLPSKYLFSFTNLVSGENSTICKGKDKTVSETSSSLFLKCKVDSKVNDEVINSDYYLPLYKLSEFHQ
jgi:hypothetical protein